MTARPSKGATIATPLPEPRVLRPRRAAPADAVRPTRAEVNLEALRHNLRVVKRAAGHARVWAVLKADGYGHGAPAVARTLERAGADGFCVALFEEGVELREAGIRAPILIMGGYYGGAFADVIAHDLTPVIYDLGTAQAFARQVLAGALPGPLDVHLKVDTGMARLGVTMDALPAFAEGLADLRELRVRGLMTHLAQADAPTDEETALQMARFDEAGEILARAGMKPDVRHAANSAALFRAQAMLDAVRPGVALFGISPFELSALGAEKPVPESDHAVPPASKGDLGASLRQAMRVRTEVVDVREVAEGARVGYGGLWRAPRASRIATVPMGYADGLSRQLTNKGHLLLRGKRAPIVGAVSMDMTMVDVTNLPGRPGARRGRRARGARGAAGEGLHRRRGGGRARRDDCVGGADEHLAAGAEVLPGAVARRGCPPRTAHRSLGGCPRPVGHCPQRRPRAW